jgi:integrase/recombinase XerD
LEAYLEAAGHKEARSLPLFLSVRYPEKRQAILSRDIHRLFLRNAKRADLPRGVRPHSARATFITEALERKCPLEAVQESVGHKHIFTTKQVEPSEILHLRTEAPLLLTRDRTARAFGLGVESCPRCVLPEP